MLTHVVTMADKRSQLAEQPQEPATVIEVAPNWQRVREASPVRIFFTLVHHWGCGELLINLNVL